MSGWVRACDFGNCAEVKRTGDTVRVRTSRMPSEEVPFTVDEWRQFVVDVKAGRFDDVAGTGAMSVTTTNEETSDA